MSDKFAMADLTGGELNAVVKTLGGSDVVKQILRGELIVKVEAKPRPVVRLLEEVGSPVEVSSVARFIARDKFVVNTKGELPISYLGDNIRANFLDVVETDVPAMTLKQRKLLKPSADAPILAALGDEDTTKIEKARTALAHVFSYLKTADRSLWFIFYVADAKGIVWAVGARWSVYGWDVYAGPVSNPRGWGAGYNVVSC
jgi:hypothetical protein